LGATAHRIDATLSTITPITKMRRRPYRSPARPAIARSVAWVTRKPVTTQEIDGTSTPRSCAISGRAMLTMLTLTTESIIPLATTISAIQRQRGWASTRARTATTRAAARSLTRRL